MVEEVQNIIGQVRDLGAQTRDVGDKVRLLERNDTNDKFGVELAETISRVEAVSHSNLVISTLLYKSFRLKDKDCMPSPTRRPVNKTVLSLMQCQRGWTSWKYLLALLRD